MRFRSEDQNDIDYNEKYRPDGYQPNPYLGKENPIELNINKLGLHTLERCYVLIDEPDKAQILSKQLLVSFETKQRNLSPPVLRVPQCMAYRGPHMLTEGFSGANVRRMKMSCVSLKVNGQCAVCNYIKNDEQQKSLPPSTYIQKCDQPYQDVAL